jgi:hypothetical protein
MKPIRAFYFYCSRHGLLKTLINLYQRNLGLADPEEDAKIDW